jgi:hypothetical protein
VRKLTFVMGFTGIVTALAAAAACSDSIPTDGLVNLPPRDAATAADADTTDSAVSCKDLQLKVGDPAACDQCAKDKCCAEVLACDKSADCKALQNCIAPCAQDDLVCILTCQEAHPKGGDLLQEVGSCAQNNCKNECPSMQSDADIFGDSGLNP